MCVTSMYSNAVRFIAVEYVHTIAVWYLYVFSCCVEIWMRLDLFQQGSIDILKNVFLGVT